MENEEMRAQLADLQAHVCAMARDGRQCFPHRFPQCESSQGCCYSEHVKCSNSLPAIGTWKRILRRTIVPTTILIDPNRRIQLLANTWFHSERGDVKAVELSLKAILCCKAPVRGKGSITMPEQFDSKFGDTIHTWELRDN